MTNGTDSEQFVLLSGVRAGLKREFAFALKVQSELSGSLGRTRTRKIQNSPTANGVSENSSNKRFKSSRSKKETKNDAVKFIIEEEPKSDLVKCLSEEGTMIDPAKAMSEDEHKNDVLEEPNNDQAKSPSEREMKNEMVKPVAEEGTSMESPVVIDDSSEVQNGLQEKSPMRFTRSALKPMAEPMDISATTSGGSVVSEDAKDVATPAIKEEPKSDFKKSLGEEKRKSDQANPMSGIEPNKVRLEEPNNVQKSSPLEKQQNNEMIKSQTEEGTCMEIPVVIDDGNEVQNALLETPSRRFTRSALKPKAEPMEISATTSGGSVVSEDAKDETFAAGGSVISEDAKNGATAKGDGKTTDVVSPLRTPPKKKLEMKMSKKIALTKFPSKVKELLDTGMLEGLGVKYLFRNKMKEGIRGMIKDSGILCSCTSCKGCKVLTPIQFELHAGSTNKRPADYIYLENGNSLRDVLNACKDAPLDTLEATIHGAIGSSPVKNATICQNCKGSFTASRIRKTILLCNSCLEEKESQGSLARTTDTTARSLKSALTPKSPSSVSKCISPPNKRSQGRITRKDLRLHKLVFEEGGLPDGTEVAYYARGQKLLEGYKKGFGIFCRCCNSEVSPSQFEAHAGWATRRKPYLQIYTSNGVSLHELSISLSKGRKSSAKDSDDLCTICADGGDLLLCDGCPRVFHKDCVSLSSIPRGDWYCKYCQNVFQKEKFVEHNANAIAAGRVSGVDPIEQITKRCIRIVKTLETEVGGCVLCRGHGFSKSGFGPRTVILCDQCEKEFHVGCLKDHKMADLNELPQGKWFCCTDCSRIHSALQKLLVHGSEMLSDALSNVIKKKHEEKGLNNYADIDVRWRLLSGKIASPETRLLLSKAVAIFHDRFDPIVDSTTGRDLIPSMVYGRNFRDQEFGGMYCAVLTVNSSVVSAGILRIFGQEVAELPMVATSSDNQGQGYFQALFSCIESLLGFLNVKNLVLPAADEAESIWTNKFGFTKIAQDQLSNLRRDCQMMTFQGTAMLQKSVTKCQFFGNLAEGS